MSHREQRRGCARVHGSVRAPSLALLATRSSALLVLAALTACVGSAAGAPRTLLRSTGPDDGSHVLAAAEGAAFWRQRCSPTGRGAAPFKRYAVTTMVSSPEYVAGANVLFYSLKKYLAPAVAAQTDFFALLIEEHGDANDGVARKLRGWGVCYVPLIPPPFEGAVPFERFREQFTKLVLWNMTQWERVLYLDSDTLAVGDVSPLLTTPRAPFAAVRDWEDGRVQQHFNMGVASLAPDRDEFGRLDAARRTKRDYRMQMAEQGLLNSLYTARSGFEPFPFEYNGNLAAAAQSPRFWARHEGALRLIHFTWIKPFDPKRRRHPDYAACAGALERWWALRAEMEANGGVPPRAAALPNATVVTAMFDALSADGRRNESHLARFRRTLALNVPMVVYTSAELAPAVAAARRGELAARTRVVTLRVPDELPYGASLTRIAEVLADPAYRAAVADRGRAECTLPEFTALRFSAFEWLAQAARLNPFGSDLFFWLDAGASRFFGVVDPAVPWPCAPDVPRDALTVQARPDLWTYEPLHGDADFARFRYDSANLVSGALFGGGAAVLDAVARGVRDIHARLLEQGVVNNEQVALAMLWRDHPELFNPVPSRAGGGDAAAGGHARRGGICRCARTSTPARRRHRRRRRGGVSELVDSRDSAPE